jgi:hypothetical protein
MASAVVVDTTGNNSLNANMVSRPKYVKNRHPPAKNLSEYAKKASWSATSVALACMADSTLARLVVVLALLEV